ncbi:protein hypothetical protein [Limosa lapponica baueri]|uniref:Uncharacterized protein n=1 Tax=Limosa lapponica baueri TaxID=1758121 RepID=A0A2I0TC54_LIMLA|nr:protein hypothetical protein [Limosa lapponica baueri]
MPPFFLPDLIGLNLKRQERETAEAREVTRKPAPRNSLENEEYVKDIIGLLNAKDFRDRINGIKQLLSDTENNQGFVVANIVKPYAVEQKVLVVLWHLLGNMTSSGSLPGAGGNMRTATAKLSRALFAQMGPSLFTQAASQPPHIRKSLEEFLEAAT